MKLLCVIDSLGSGGAQRQMVNLACGLKARGHEVEMLVYFPQYQFFRSHVDSAGIVVHEVEKGLGFSWKVVLRISRLMHIGKYDALISFLGAPNLYCELAKILTKSRTRLIVSERSNSVGEKGTFLPVLFRLMHWVADAVVANSNSHAEWLRKRPWLRSRTHVIYNGYAISSFELRPRGYKIDTQLSYLVVGRVHSGKNGVRLIEALALYVKKHGYAPSVAWVGRQETDAESGGVRKQMEELLSQHPDVAASWQWMGERNDVGELLQLADAVIHVSLYEGLPNVICEAFIAGRPVIASNVCDHPVLVEDGVRGVLCEPLSAKSICEAIERYEALTMAARAKMGVNARRYAEDNLSIGRMVSAYEDLLSTV